jgi:hypothetical protein
MSDFSSIGKGLMVLGVVLVVIGALVLSTGKIPFLGRLPGDIKIEKENFSFYFSLATCLLLSMLVSFLFWLFSKFK